MQSPIQKFRQSSIVLIKFYYNNFYWNLVHVPYLPMFTKGCSGFSFFCFELEFFAKIKKNLVATHSQKPGLSITQNLKK